MAYPSQATMKSKGARSVGKTKIVSAASQKMPSEQVLALPIAPSWNSLYRRSRQGGMFMTKEGHSYKETIQMICKIQKCKPYDGDVFVKLRWYRDAKRGDLDNREKILYDALQGYLYHKDSQIAHKDVARIDGDPNPRFYIEVRKI